MELKERELQILGQQAISAAYQVGSVIEKYPKAEIIINHKKGGNSLASQIVTEVDILSQKRILEVLAPINKHFDIGLLSEECEDDGSRMQKDFFWCIDPIDGTLPFTESIEGYSVSIALVSKEGTPMIGVVYDPYNKNMYHAIINQGAYINGLIWSPKQKSNSNNFTLISDRSFLNHPHYDKIVSNIQNFGKAQGYDNLKFLNQGGAVMNAIWVLENSPACYFKFPKKTDGGGSLWDYAATACIFNECNKMVSDLFGSPLDLNRKESTFMNHKGILYASNNAISNEIQKIFNSISE